MIGYQIANNNCYNGDNARVKSVMQTNYASSTTYFVGTHYEVTGTQVNKYYYAGSQRIATLAPHCVCCSAGVRKNGTLNYILGDHLGSTSLVTDENGVVINQTQYKACPQGASLRVKRDIPAEQSKRATAIQVYSYAADFGLQFYNVRWYDSSLGRFTSADTIVPGGVQGYDRYAYTNNNPVNFNDPTGHAPSCDDWDGCHHDSSGGDRDDDTDTDGDGIPNIPDPDQELITPGRGEQSDCLPGNLVECFYNNGIMPGGDYEITLAEFLLLMKAIGYDVARRDATVSYTDFRGWYDTPFFDGGGDDALKSNMCVQLVGCFARSELNYIAQGEISGAAIEGKGMMTLLIVGWKLDQYETGLPSFKTLQAAAIGHDYYVMTHPINILMSLTTIRNPVPFYKTVNSYCQTPNPYCAR